MEKMHGPNFEVKLYLMEGRDFGFINGDFKIISSLDGTPIESTFFQSGPVVNFNSELVWTSSKENIRKMRNYKVPVRLDFYKAGEKSKKSFGYIILNMKAAQYIPSGGDKVPMKEETHKVCGTPKEAIGCHPEIVLSLRIQDANENSEIFSSRTVDNGNIGTERLLPIDSSISAFALTTKNEDLIPPTLDPSHEDVGAGGESLAKEPKQKIGGLHRFCLEIAIRDCHWKADLENVHIRFHHAKAEVNWSAHETIPKVCAGQTITDLSSVTSKFNFVEEPTHFLQILAEVPPSLSICEIDCGRPKVLGVALLALPSLTLTESISGSSEIKELGSKNELATVFYEARLIDHGIETVQQLSITSKEADFLGESIKDELERWKDKEREKFHQEFDEKLKVELSRLQSLSKIREEEMQAEVNRKIEMCRKLNDELQTTIERIKLREAHIRSQLDKEYKSLMKDETLDFHSRIKDKEVIICDLQNRIEELLTSAKQHNQMNRDIKSLEDKLEKANETKIFFKNQWVRAVRELHRVKTGGVSDIPVRLTIKKEKLQQLGLSDLFDDNYSS